METLPPETKEYIFSFLDTETVEDIVAKVCGPWNEIAIKILESRVKRMMSHLNSSNIDFKSRLHSSVIEDKRKLLREYENSFIKTKFEIKSQRRRL